MKPLRKLRLWLLCFCFFTINLSVSGQDTTCVNRFVSVKQQSISTTQDLSLHFDALDSMITICEYEDADWIDRVIKQAISNKDTFTNHSFSWNYYRLLKKSPSRKEETFRYLKQIVQYSEDNDFQLSGDYYVTIGLEYNKVGDYANELNAYQKSLEAFKRDKSKHLNFAYGTLGYFYLQLGNYEEALSYTMISYELGKKVSDEDRRNYVLSNACLNLGEIYDKLDSLEKAETYHNLALELALKQSNCDLTILNYDAIINLYLNRDKIEEVEALVMDSDQFISKVKLEQSYRLSEANLTYHQLVKSKYGIKTNKTQFITDPKEIKVSDLSSKEKKEYYHFSIEYAQENNQMKRALGYAITLNDIVISESKDQKISAVDLLIEKQNNVQLQKENLALLESERTKANHQRIFLAVVSLLGIGLLFFSWNLRKSIEYNKSINGKRNRIEAQYKELERISYVMTHDLKEPINTVNSFTRLLLKKHADELSEKAKSYFNIIYDTSDTMLRSVNSLHNHLLLGVKSKLKVSSLENAWIAAQTNLKAVLLQNDVLIKSDPLPSLICYEDEMTTLFQSLLSNAVKYSKKAISPKVNLTCTESSSYFTFAFSDEGIGMNADRKDSIFDLFKRIHEETDIDGSGIGLANARKIVEYHKGEIWVESKLHQGSTFYFTISKNLS